MSGETVSGIGALVSGLAAGADVVEVEGVVPIVPGAAAVDAGAVVEVEVEVEVEEVEEVLVVVVVVGDVVALVPALAAGRVVVGAPVVVDAAVVVGAVVVVGAMVEVGAGLTRMATSNPVVAPSSPFTVTRKA